MLIVAGRVQIRAERRTEAVAVAEFNARIGQFVAAPPSIDRYEIAGVRKLL